MVAKPPPYIEAMMQKQPTNSARIFHSAAERGQHIERRAEHEEDEVGHLAPELVGGRRPARCGRRC